MTTIDKLSVDIELNSSKLQTGLNQANQTVSSFTDRIAQSASTLQGFGQVGMHAMGIMDRFEISSMNVQNALMSVQDAQMRYNSALQEFGAGSEQAAIAQNSLERATNQYEASQMRANLSLASMGLTMFGMIPDILKFGTTLTTTMRNAEIATLLTSARLKALAPELLLISAVAGGVYYLWSTQTQKAELDTRNFGNTAVTSFNGAKMTADQLREAIKKLNDEIKKTQEQTQQAQTPLDMYLSYAGDTTGVRAAQSTDEFLGDRTKLPPTHPLYQPSAKTQKLIQERSGLETQLTSATFDEAVSEYVNKFKTSKSGLNIGYGGQGLSAPYQPPAGTFTPPSNVGTEKLSEIAADIKQTMREPRQVTINANIYKNDDVSDTFNNIGMGLAQGLDMTKFKPR